MQLTGAIRRSTRQMAGCRKNFWQDNRTPIYGVELNPKTFDLIGQPVECLNSDKDNFGWERPGDYNTKEQRPYLPIIQETNNFARLSL